MKYLTFEELIKKIKIYNKEDIYMLPKGDKIYRILEKLKIY